MIGGLAAGFVLLSVGGALLVRGASDLARVMGMPPILIGLTIVAFGTSAPELAASVAAAWRGQGDVALGNVVGSNILNVLLILGVAAGITPLVVAQRLIWIDVPVMIGLSVAVLALGADGAISRGEGVLLVAVLCVYVAYSVRMARREPPLVEAEYAHEFGGTGRRTFGAIARSALTIVVGLALLVWGSRWLVDGAVSVARALGTSELIIGLTIVAAGTSLPEIVTSVVAAWRGERDIAVGNVVGSNIFNLLGVLGGAAALAPDGVAVSAPALRFDVPVMIVTAVACLPIFLTEHRIDRWEGIVLVGYYAAYVAFLVLDATDHDQLPVFSGIMIAFVVPLTVLTFAITLFRHRRSRHDVEKLR